MNIPTPWVDIAGKYLGERETSDPNDSPFIRRMLAALNASWLLGQPWCGIFVAKVFGEAGLTYPRDYYRARSWSIWGLGLTAPCYGCVVTMERKGGGHVGIVIGQTSNGDLVVRGGNQGDAVRDSVFPKDRAGGFNYRWPIGWRMPEQFALPTLGGEKSTSEA